MNLHLLTFIFLKHLQGRLCQNNDLASFSAEEMVKLTNIFPFSEKTFNLKFNQLHLTLEFRIKELF
jgi:hypothetical protein